MSHNACGLLQRHCQREFRVGRALKQMTSHRSQNSQHWHTGSLQGIVHSEEEGRKGVPCPLQSEDIHRLFGRYASSATSSMLHA